MRVLDVSGTKPTVYRFSIVVKKLLALMLVLLLSFSAEKEKTNVNLAQTYFYKGYIEYTQENYSDAIREFSRSYVADAEGYYGELSYLYIGMSYAQLSHRTGSREGIMSALAYLNMYPYYYKRPTYTVLQKEFIGESYLLLGLYDKARDVYMALYRDTGKLDYLLNFLYSDALSYMDNYMLIEQIDPNSLGEKRYLYYLIKAFYAFGMGMHKDAVRYFLEARLLNRYVEDNPEFLYRHAVSSFMERDWKNSIFYFEQLDRKDIYKKYADSANYYLAMIYLMNKNYTDAKKRLDNMSDTDSLKNRLILSQLWLFPEFLQKYEKDYKKYRELLKSMAWVDLNSVYSTPAVLGLYYYSIKDKKLEDKDLFRLKRLTVPREIVFQDIRVDMRVVLEKLNESFQSLNPYGKDAEFIMELYKVNPSNYALLFGYEKLARSVLYTGNAGIKDVLSKVDEPLRSFFEGQFLLLEGSEEGLKLVEKAQKDLTGEDRQEALFIIGIYKKDVKLLESLVKEKHSERLKPYLEPALLELGDYYYSRADYTKAKEYYRSYMEIAQEGDLYWLVAYRLAKAGALTGDRETLNWVVKKAEGKDNIISKVIVALWG
ncbi:MAG: hypothetical protein NZ526_03440 [Aquificaceae bacterium]|nr:hypothetical protein [Aquificaceae bacterium]